MRSIGIRWLGVAALTAYGGAAWAIDPLPVHTATTRMSATNLQPADRLALADAVAQVFVEAGYQDVVPATETRNRLQDVGPVGLSCDAAECAQNVWNPLHARGLVLVRQQRSRTRVQFTIQYLNLRGEAVAEEQRDEAITSWAEAIAFARAAATSMALHIPAEYRGPQVTPDAGTPPPDASAPDAGAVPPQDAQVIIVHDADVPPPPVMVRRWWEVGVGAGLAAGGLALTLTSVVNFANHGTDQSLSGGVIERQCALGAPTQTTAQGTTCDGVGVVTPLLLGVGIAAMVGGAFLVVDGMRLRPEAASATPRPRAWQFGATPLARGGGVFTLSGGF